MTELASSSAAAGLPTGPSLAELAADEFERRRATARRKVAAGELAPPVAEAHLRPWLALAARFGAELPELYDEGEVIFPYSEAGQPAGNRRLSIDIAPPAEVAEALATARDIAIERVGDGLDPARNERARRLETLAIAFGVRPYLPAREKESA